MLDPCEEPTITTSEVAAVTYKLSSEAKVVKYTAFTIVPDLCSVTYQASFPSGSAALFTADNAGMSVSIKSSDAEYVGTHTVLIYAVSAGGVRQATTLSFNVTVVGSS